MTTQDYFQSDQLELFIERLYKNAEEGYFELRFLNEGDVEREWFEFPLNVNNVTEMVSRYAGKYHCYFGVNPRTGTEDGKKESIKSVIGLWADLDSKDFSGGMAEAKSKVDNFEVEPTVLVNSGNGYHAYYTFNSTVELHDDAQIDHMEKLNKRLQYCLDADATPDITRILRLPGSPNIKDPDDPTGQKTTEDKTQWNQCTLETVNFTYYETDDLNDIIPNTVQTNTTESIDVDEPTNIHSLDDLRQQIPHNVLERAKTCPPKHKDDRSANDFFVARKLYEHGLTDADIIQAFKLFAENGWDTGEKFKQRGKEYLINYTLPNAKNKSNRYETIIEEIKQAESKIEKVEKAEDIYPLVARMSPAKQELAIEQLQELLDMNKRPIKQEVKKAGKFTPRKVGQEILSHEDFLHTAGQLYHYEDGVYKKNGLSRVKTLIQEKLGNDWNQHKRSNVVEWIIDFTHVDNDDLKTYDHLINVQNGMYDIQLDELKPHSPEYNSLTQLHCQYDPDAQSDLLDRFMDETFDEGVRPLIWEHCGHILVNHLSLKKFVVLYGPTDTGKSVFVNMIQHVLGKENVARESLQDLANTRWSPAKLFGSLACIDTELKKKALENTDTLKKITGGDDYISAEFKGRDKFEFNPKSKLFFTCNDLPPVANYDQAFFNRLHLINCSSQVPEDEQDPELGQKLAEPEAKSAWLNKAIEGAKRLMEQNKFSVPNQVKRNVARYRLSSDSVSKFIHTQLEKNRGGYETKNDVYEAYRTWCDREGMYPVKKGKFTRRAKKEPNNLVMFHPKHKGRQRPAWENVRLKSDSIKEIKDG